MKKFTYDMLDHIETPIVVLSTKWHHHLGLITNIPDGLNVVFNMNSVDEVSFDVHKEWDGKKCELWDKIINFKYIYIPEYESYYEIYVTIDDTDNTVKHVTSKAAGEVELSNRKLIDFHCNDETDITYTAKYKVQDGQVIKTGDAGVVDFQYDMSDSDLLPGQTELIKATILYRPILDTDSEYLAMKKRRASLLHRVLKDKCPDWGVGMIDETVAKIQRTFTGDNIGIYEFLTNTVGKELDCLFEFDSVNRKISAHDLLTVCSSCGYRGTFMDKCPKCESTRFIIPYGKQTGIFLNTENFVTEINLSGNTDNVKNCLRLIAGDDEMTAAVRNINPNGSQYIYHFSDEMLDDMPDELVSKIISYNELYESKEPEYTILTERYYELLDRLGYLQHSMMPETPIPGETTAKKQLAILEECFRQANPEKAAVEDIAKASTSTAESAVQGLGKALVDPRYTVKIKETVKYEKYDGYGIWQGRFTVTDLGYTKDMDNKDGKYEATSTASVLVTVTGDYETFLRQKLLKQLDRSDASLVTIFKIDDETEFKAELKKYSLERLKAFKGTYEGVVATLINAEATTTNANFFGADLKTEIYDPYYRKLGYIEEEIAVRDGEVETVSNELADVVAQRKVISDQLDFPTYLGDKLFTIFSMYRMEGDYNNSNYISTDLENNEIVEKAKEFFEVAQDEAIKASQIELTISETLNNLLNTKEFRDFKDGFNIGDWLITEVDGKIYRLRLIGVTYDYSSPAGISFTFSNVDRMKSMSDELTSILDQAKSIAGTYNTVTHQAEQGNDAKDEVSSMQNDGVDSGTYNIFSGINSRVVIDENGILLADYNSIEGKDYDEQLKIINNGIYFTDDNWANVKTAIGKIRYELNGAVQTRYGVNAETLIAGLMIAGEIYSQNYSSINGTGTYFNLDNGEFTIGNESLVYRDGLLNIKNTVINWESVDAPAVTNIAGLSDALNAKQNKLIAGDNITIDQSTNVISAIVDAHDYRELTQAEYDALSYAEKHNGTVYYITDGQGGGGGGDSGNKTLYGTIPPTASQGNNGDSYALYDDATSTIVTLYVKINGTWMAYVPPVSPSTSGSSVRQLTITDITRSTNTISAYETPESE